MFSQKKSTNTRKKPDYHKDLAITILTSGCHFSGKLYCRGSTRIGGKIEGEIISEGLLIIEEDAVISANIRGDEAVIQGKVCGKIEAQSRVELCSSCTFEGDISAPVLVIQEGAVFNGRSEMGVDRVKPKAELPEPYEVLSHEKPRAEAGLRDGVPLLDS